ncbi:cap-specific mRNA (nucleoside-2'-O-)-methyltransferase 1-like protein [Dinothrombium tinctorium]|uniref:Cap-specific mRNA (nucleoside-2'-O-)-methyltransferase 1 n=1 Tax=Dinothrombium tinctorium TaxID=1965070 RepID=A0A3S3S4E8_9ACAR|nr:cap-specific mRNA (nucleoside-2'-O-)-methyltransferase 1-like protein [Dinothrombium tinctorium]RWS08968.1 cap-specific mRNA (nucleoside-2'-O-)-methyltransferase 1-like protein [Dinothrombium tinctorium]
MAHKLNLKRKCVAEFSGNSSPANSKKNKRSKIEELSDDSDSLEISFENSNPSVNKKADIGSKLMQKMGYREGKGLGKHEQGLVDVIETSTQKGRRGLGFKHQEIAFDPDLKWDPDLESQYVSVEEAVDWCPGCMDEPYTTQELKAMIVVGPKKLTIDDEFDFCEQSVVRNVCACKSVFDRLSGVELRNARSMSNPFETINKSIFQNRAALKMANLDAVCDFMFTDPKDENGISVLNSHELLYFADICAGPGGFSEYILWRKGWEAKGFGLTLKNENDFKLGEFLSGTPETFEPHYGLNGVNGDGNIYNPRNLVEFRDFVLQNTDKKGVHFVMADGGFSVEGEENIQEIRSKRLYLCQFVCALSIIRSGGHFVCKLFDVFTRFSVGLVYLMYKSFEKIAIHKPNSSRPANSERYLICKGKYEDTTSVENFLFELNCQLDIMEKNKDSNDILELVSIDVLKNDANFFRYIYDSNTKIGERQIHFLLKVKAFAENSELKEVRQAEMKKECLAYWKIPNKSRTAQQRPDPLTKFTELTSKKSQVARKSNIGNNGYLTYKPQLLLTEKLKELEYPWSYKCMVIATDETNSNDRGFFLGLGGQVIYFWNGSSSSKWTRVDIKIELPSETLIYGEKVQECRGEGRSQMHSIGLHIIDALFLGGKDVRHLSFTDRIAMSNKLIKAVTKTSLQNRAVVRAKKLYDLYEMQKLYDDLDMKELKSTMRKERLCHQLDYKHFIVPAGVLLFNTIRKPWSCKISNSTGKFYYFNYEKKSGSVFECPNDAIADFEYTFSTSLFWKWYNDNYLVESEPIEEPSHVTRNILSQHLNKVLSR